MMTVKMKRPVLVLNLLGVLALALACAAFAISPVEERTVTPAEARIRDAAMIENPAVRENALREAIRAGLLANDATTRSEVFSFLNANVRWIDLQPFGDLLIEFSKIDKLTYRGPWLLDDATFFRADRDYRVSVYRQAIVEGKAVLPHGSVWLRFAATEGVADDGIQELWPLAEKYASQLLPVEQAQLPGLKARMQLSAGAKDRDDAALLAAERLRALRDEDFRARMTSDRGFADAVAKLARQACEFNPFQGTQRAGCKEFQEIFERQLRLANQRAETRRIAEGVPQGRPPEESWIESLKVNSHYGERSWRSR